MTIDEVGKVLRLLRTLYNMGLVPVYISTLDDVGCEVWYVCGKTFYIDVEEEDGTR